MEEEEPQTAGDKGEVDEKRNSNREREAKKKKKRKTGKMRL